MLCGDLAAALRYLGSIPPLKEGVMEPLHIPPFDLRFELVLLAIMKYSHMFSLRSDLKSDIQSYIAESGISVAEVSDLM